MSELTSPTQTALKPQERRKIQRRSRLNIPVFVDLGRALVRQEGWSKRSFPPLFGCWGWSGLIFNRKLFRGSEGLSGEIGHLTLDPAKNRQAEGKGAVETQLGRDGLLASYRRAGGGAENLETFLRDLRKKKPLAQETVRAWGEWLTLAIRNLADLFNPQLVVLAGPLSELFPFVEDEVKKSLRDRRFPTVESLEVEVSSFGKDASALGAAALVYDQILSVPDSNFLEDLDLNEGAIEQEISRLGVD